MAPPTSAIGAVPNGRPMILQQCHGPRLRDQARDVNCGIYVFCVRDATCWQGTVTPQPLSIRREFVMDQGSRSGSIRDMRGEHADCVRSKGGRAVRSGEAATSRMSAWRIGDREGDIGVTVPFGRLCPFAESCPCLIRISVSSQFGRLGIDTCSWLHDTSQSNDILGVRTCSAEARFLGTALFVTCLDWERETWKAPN